MPTPVHAAVLSGVDEPFVFADLVIGDIEPDEVIVKITAVGLCHTDLAVQHGHIPAAFPIVLGHEGSGVIEQIGSAVSGFAVGDAVALSFAACGRCRNCLAGREAYCVNFMALNFGGARENGTTTLADADTGAVGLSGIMGAKVAGATTIIAIDILDERLEVAASLGATHTINSKDADPIEKIMEITGGGVDFVLDTTGVAPVIASLIQAAAFGAKIALVGVPRPGSSIDLGLVSATGKTIIGAIEGDAIPQTFIPQMLSLYEAGLFPFDKLITTYPFDQIEQAIADTASGKAVKAVLVMP